ncbi:MAG: hypothetical protein V1787_04890 [Candidatus Micrarchaeota archaeon]
MEELARLLRRGGWSCAHGYAPGRTVERFKVGRRTIAANSHFTQLVLVPREELGAAMPRDEVMKLVRRHFRGYAHTLSEALGGRRDGIVARDYETPEISPLRRLAAELKRMNAMEKRRG